MANDFTEILVKLCKPYLLLSGPQVLGRPLGSFAVKYETNPLKSISSIQLARSVDSNGNSLLTIAAVPAAGTVAAVYVLAEGSSPDSEPISVYSQSPYSGTAAASLTYDDDECLDNAIQPGALINMTIRWN